MSNHVGVRVDEAGYPPHADHRFDGRDSYEAREGHGSTWSAADGAGVLSFRNQKVFLAASFGVSLFTRPKHGYTPHKSV